MAAVMDEDVPVADPKRHALLMSMSGEAREMASSFFGFADAYRGAADETQTPASEALIREYPQAARLFSTLAEHVRDHPDSNVVDECLRQADMATRHGLSAASIQKAVEDYSIAVHAPPKNNSSELHAAAQEADSEDLVSDVSGMGHSVTASEVPGEPEQDTTASIHQYPPGVTPVQSTRMPSRFHPYPDNRRIPYPAESDVSEHSNPHGPRVMDGDEDLNGSVVSVAPTGQRYPGGARIPYPTVSDVSEYSNPHGERPMDADDPDLNESTVSGVSAERGREPALAPPQGRDAIAVEELRSDVSMLKHHASDVSAAVSDVQSQVAQVVPQQQRARHE